MRNRGRKTLCMLLALLLTFLPALAEEAGPDIRHLQERLLALGYEIGEADGIAGPRTAMAVRLVQQLLAGAGFGVTPTGVPDRQTAELTDREENSVLLQTLLRGSWGSRVRAAQNRLIELNLLWDLADGTYGANTEKAVSDFEAKMETLSPGLVTEDGRLSLPEYALLMSDLSAYGFEAPVFFDEEHPEGLKAEFLYARNACLINAVTGETLLEKNADEKAEPASTTKIMTLLTALSMCDPEAAVVIPEEAAQVPADSSLVPVYPGLRMRHRAERSALD